MLPRISSALSQFIKPVATSQAHNSLLPKKDESFTRHQQKPQQESEPATAPVIPISSAKPTAQPPVNNSGGLPFAGLFSLLAEQRALIWRWLGRAAYISAAREQKKTGRCRKGTLLDEKAG